VSCISKHRSVNVKFAHLPLTVIPIVILSTFKEFTGIIYELHHNYPGKFSIEVFETFPCVSIGMLKQLILLLLRFFATVIEFHY
jgi:hypothetical protein